MTDSFRRVTGLGGIFFKCADRENLLAWYTKHLGIVPVAGGSSGVFEWRDKDNSGNIGHTVWCPFKGDTPYFGPSTKEFMINYRVENLEALLEELRREGVQVAGEVEAYDYGKFGWIMDPEGNKIELREPSDVVFAKMNSPGGGS